MVSGVIIPTGTPLHDVLRRVAADHRIVFLAGLSGVGKSFLLQQLALMAHDAGRVVHLLQWDVSRAAFETPEILARYPEVDGATHMAIRKAVGRWVRDGVRRWHEAHPSPEQMLLGEPPLAGNRLIELVQRKSDAAETLLAGPDTHFLVPVPTQTVRRAIESARERSIAHPKHERDSSDAPPNVMQDDWCEIWRRGCDLGLVPPPPGTDAYREDRFELPRKYHGRITEVPRKDHFDPALYATVYEHLLRHRRHELVTVDTVFAPHGSVYDLDIIASELSASPDEVTSCMADVEASGDLSAMQDA